MFKRKWFTKIFDEAPAGLRWKRGYDLAISTKTTANYTASFRCAYDTQGNLYIADGFRVGDKVTRALAWLNLAEEGKVILVRGAWIDEFVDEICRFPAGRHDDQIDAVSIAVNMLSKAKSGFYTFA